ncbi:variant erythrocyte surface antigen-1 family protein [Babesia caballi]|uniref:Variant erythrocyte surface antigen-1 family protein n=1 Tax=Babesia caballi TaxID=5871 RepID=A0AAV4LZW1_BABCB|nr:variant erythrocyte surface antigen-1 family protein [Babesia caballi]
MGDGKSLTTPPQNLKEAIDWLALVGGGFGGSGCGLGKNQELEKSLKKLDGFDDIAKTALKISNYSGLIKNLADKLGYGFLGYQVQGGGFNFTGKGIIQQANNYTSKYQDATWNGSDQDKDMALIFLGSACVMYYFVTFLYWHCKSGIKGDWIGYSLNQDSNGQWLGQFMKAMGFTLSQLQNKLGHEVAQILGDGYNAFDELDNISNIHLKYSIFHTALIKKASIQPLSCPLTACYTLAKEYFSLKSENTDVKNAMERIKNEIESIRGHGADNYSTLKQSIKTFLTNVTTFMPTPALTPPQSPQSGASTTSPSQSSSVGPAAGGLVGVGALGAGAAYGLNLDWILRVTGKDGGGGGSGNETKLADAVVGLNDFKQAVEAAAEKLQESEGVGVSQALGELNNSATLGTIIGELTDGLGDFIGYDGSNGTIKENKGIGQRPKKDKNRQQDDNGGKPYNDRAAFLSARRTQQFTGLLPLVQPFPCQMGTLGDQFPRSHTVRENISQLFTFNF